MLTSFETALKEGHSLIIEGLWDAPKALLAATAARATHKSVLLITGGMREDRLFDDLSYFAPDLPVEFPAWETLPGEEIAPSPDILGKRFEALHTLFQKKGPSVVLCPLQSLLQKVVPKEILAPLFATWKKGDTLPFHTLAEHLTSLGYRRVPLVSDKGEFAMRGGILDLFPIASTDPYRVDFFGDQIEQIRTFDPVGQKSIAKVSELFLTPASELSLLQKAKRLTSLPQLLGNPLIFWDDLLAIEDSYVALKQMPGAQSPFFFSLDDLLKTFDTQLFFTKENIETLSEVVRTQSKSKAVRFDVFGKTFEAERFAHPFLPIQLPPEEKNVTFLSVTDTEEAEIRKEYPDIQAQYKRGYLTSGFVLNDTALIPYAEISGKHHIRRQKWRSTYHTPASEFHALSPGDLVVHFHSGIGKFLGMEKQVNHLGQETEFLTIEYAEGSKLFVPLSQAYLVSRYIGTHEAPPSLSQLGAKRWQTLRDTAQAQIVGYANDLLALYAERAVQGGFRYAPDSDLMRQFEQEFPYLPTEDQASAILALKNDMTSEKPMDRLICGDVGYGKTEVAMRAAFKAVVDGGKQVAVLVPTTVLAMQHYENFAERMKGFPVTVEVVSRVRTPKEMRATLEKLKTGQVDILVGTHRLLSKDVQFRDLGLLIIDEEQRFGVRAKEHLKKLKIGVDCLTLSATPIPRTLYMSLVHARDMSVINTPPQDRLPIKTIIAETDPELIQNALMREFSRGGQAFYIHNRVETIYERATAIQKLVPTARIGVVHGQMDPDDADALFHRFKQGEIDLLFATTIVENGIDISNANTLLVDRADTYGLADLYQLRGRVGRWNRSAYAYLLIPKNARLPDPTRKRLNALVEASGYGGGMKIAMRDLEIRGAGDILGVQQSGQVSTIGFHLYCKLLKRAIDSLKAKKPITFNETKLESSYDARIPDTYIDAVSLRMEIYYRLGEATTFSSLGDLLSELTDRFGPPPPPVLWLYHLSRIRAFASANQFTLIKFGHLSFYAEQQMGKQLEKRTMLLPKKVQHPTELEKHVIEQLRAQFVCQNLPEILHSHKE